MSFTRADYPPLSSISYISTITSVIFNPTSIAGGVLWIDASLFTQANNTAVTTWPSASGSYSLYMTGTGTVNTNILNGLPVISISTAQNWSLSAGYTSAAYTFFFVSRQTGGTNRRVFIGGGNRLYGYWGGYKNQLYTEGWLTPQSPGSDTAWDIYTIVRTSSGSGTFSRFGGNISTYGSSGAGMDGFYINTGGSYGGETSDAQIAEVLIYNVDLSDANCRKIEGYLAWKWGLQANLTSGHIHASSGPSSSSSTLTSTLNINLAGYVQSGANYVLKPQIPLTITPYYTAFNPITLSTLALWIDGADPLGTGIVPTQGTLISSLKDKSGNNRPVSTFSTTVGFPTYKTAANGSLGAIELLAGNGIFLSSIALTPSMSLYLVYSPINPGSGMAIEQGVNAQANPGFLLTSVSTISTVFTIGTLLSFTPLSIASLSLWLDASQSSYFTFASSSNISSWADRSGKANNATQPTAGIQPTYAGSTVYLNGSQWFAVNLDFLAGHDFSAFIVLNNTNYVNIYGALGGGSFSGSSYLHNGFSSSGGYRVNYYSNDYYPSITANYHAGTTNLINIDWINTGGVGKSVRANGSIEGGPNGQTGTITAMANGGTIANVVGQGILSGTIYEIIFILDTDITTTNRNKLEGYLMWKWGIQSYLPTGHPYKSAAP